MSDPSRYLPSALILGTLLVASVALTVGRPRWRSEVRTSGRFLAVAGLTIVAQAVHFLEELHGGFDERFPETFGLQPMSEVVFIVFSVTWLLVWVPALFGARAGGSFPGALSAPLVGVLGVFLLRELAGATSRAEPSS